MYCIACGNGKLTIINSRKHAREPRVWRRRHCTGCGLTFTSYEQPDYDNSFMIGREEAVNGRARPRWTTRAFSKAGLIRDLFNAGGHMKDQQVLLWLAETIAGKAFAVAMEHAAAMDNDGSDDDPQPDDVVPGRSRKPVLNNEVYQAVAYKTLAAYDELLAANYRARMK